jgi:hypothetical protein
MNTLKFAINPNDLPTEEEAAAMPSLPGGARRCTAKDIPDSLKSTEEMIENRNNEFFLKGFSLFDFYFGVNAGNLPVQ